MSVIKGLENVPRESHLRAVAVGVFDGVHWGHRAIFQTLKNVAFEHGVTSAALTFDKHPTELLAPTRAPRYINTLDQRVELIESIGVDEVVVAEFSPELASLEREEFVRRILLQILRAAYIVVGSNFRFGKGREGDTAYLKASAPEFGIGVTVVPAVIVDGGPASSTRIRALVSRGDVSEASRILGRRFTLRGTVVVGQQIGRKLGFPTANIFTAPRQIIPARGVYVVETTIHGTVYNGVCNIGHRPTFSGLHDTVEVHLSGFQGDLYGETLDVVFCRRLRDEMAFESPEKLADQIRKDIEKASSACAG